MQLQLIAWWNRSKTHPDSRNKEYLLILKRDHNAIIKDIRDSALQIKEKSKISRVDNGCTVQIHFSTPSSIIPELSIKVVVFASGFGRKILIGSEKH